MKILKALGLYLFFSTLAWGTAYDVRWEVLNAANDRFTYPVTNSDGADAVFGWDDTGKVPEEYTFTPYTQSLAAAIDDAAWQALLNLEVGTDLQGWDADLDIYATITPSANVQSLMSAADYAAMRALLSLEDSDINALITAAFTAPTFVTSIAIGSATIEEAELEILDGATLTTTELNYADGVTSDIQTQLDAKVDFLIAQDALGALEIDTTERAMQTKTISADQTFTFDAEPASGTWWRVRIKNSDSSDHVATIPSSYSEGYNGARTEITIPANGQNTLYWWWDGTVYTVSSDYVDFYADISEDLTPTDSSVDSMPYYDVATGAAKRIPIDDLLALGSSAPGTDSVGTDELDDDANSPTAGDILIVETGGLSFDYVTPLAAWATWVAAPSSLNFKNLITNETGSGALVFAENGVLVTPNLGTPSAAVMTNASGVAASLTAGSVTIADNESTNETNAVLFTPGGDVDGGNLTPETDGDFTYNPSTGTVEATAFTAGGVAVPTISSANVLSGKSVDFDTTPGTDDTYEGLTITGLTSAETLAMWNVVYIDASGDAALADASAEATADSTVGLACNATTGAQAVTVIYSGVVRNDAWNWTAGDVIWLSETAGEWVAAQPTTSEAIVLRIGTALSADEILVNIDGTFDEVE